MPEATLSGADFKKQLREGSPKMGLFLNAHSPTVAEQLAHSGYDWLLVDTQHGPMGYEKLSAMLSGISNGGAKSMVRVGGYDDRPGIQQALDMGADGVLVPYINTAEEARQAVSCTKYPTTGTRSVYFPQRSMNKAGLLGYAGNFNNNGIIALQVETASCIENIAEIAAVPGVDILFLGQNDLCMSMGLYEKYEFPTCTPRRNWAPPPRSWSTTRARTRSFSDSSCSAPRAWANSSKRDSPSSASATTCTMS